MLGLGRGWTGIAWGRGVSVMGFCFFVLLVIEALGLTWEGVRLT